MDSVSIEIPVCDCGKNVVESTSWQPNNPGRRLWVCPRGIWCESHKFLGWKDPPVEGRSKEVINSLNRVRKKLLGEVIPDLFRSRMMIQSENNILRCELKEKKRKIKIMWSVVGFLMVLIAIMGVYTVSLV